MLGCDLDNAFWLEASDPDLDLRFENFFIATAENLQVILYQQNDEKKANFPAEKLELADLLVNSTDTADLTSLRSDFEERISPVLKSLTGPNQDLIFEDGSKV